MVAASERAFVTLEPPSRVTSRLPTTAAPAACAGRRAAVSAGLVAVADLLEVAEDGVAREVEGLGDLLGGALDEEGAALLEALDDLHLLFARHGGGRLAHLGEDLGDHAGDHLADVGGEDLAGLGGGGAVAAADRGDVGERVLRLDDLGDIEVEAEQAERLAVLVAQRHGERFEDLAVVGRDVQRARPASRRDCAGCEACGRWARRRPCAR